MSLAESIAHALGNGKEQKSGSGWLTLCPCHGDTNNSLSITDTDDPKKQIIVECFAKCDYKAIKDAIRDLGLLPKWTPDPKVKPRNGSPSQLLPKPPATKEPYQIADSTEDQNKAATIAGVVWQEATLALPDHPYLKRKQVSPTELIKEIDMARLKALIKYHPKGNGNPLDDGRVLIIPVIINGKISSIEMIDEAGHKTALSKGRKKDGYWPMRKLSAIEPGVVEKVLIGEGVATVLSGYEATGYLSIAALANGNIYPTALQMKEKFPYAEIIIVADIIKESGKPDSSAVEAAVKLGCKLAVPDFGEGRELRQTDINDLFVVNGKDAVRDCIEIAKVVEQDKKQIVSTAAKQDMFERFVFLASENKIIDTVGHDIKDSMMIERAFILSQAGQIYHYQDEEGKDKEMPLTKYWLMSDEKKTASALKYSPGSPLFFANGDGRNYFNTFRFPYQLSPLLPAGESRECLSNWNKIMDTVFHEHRGYIEDWLSFSIQHPEKRSGIMPVCVSEVGLGKSLVMSIMCRVVGYHNFSNGKVLDVTGLGPNGTQWGDWIYNKKISCIEEMSPEGEIGLSYRLHDSLKDIITNETLPLNLKGGRNGTFQVFSNIIGFSNHEDFMKIPFKDRRMYVVDSTGQEKLSDTEYKDLWEWLKIEKNIIAVYQYLLARTIGKDFIPGQAKMTKAKKRLQAGGRSLMQMAFDIVIEQFPCDLVTNNELRLAVAQAMHHIEGGVGIVPADTIIHNDKQFQAILKGATTVVADNKRIRVKRLGGEKLNPSNIRALRNKKDWIDAPINEIREAMLVNLPYKWIMDDEEKEPF